MVKITSIIKEEGQIFPRVSAAPAKPGYFANLENLLAGSISKKELVMLAKRLAFLMRAGVPILESLQTLKVQMKTKGGKQILEQMVVEVSNGHFLSSAMEKNKKVFGEFAVNIIRVGEMGGILSENLHYLAEELKKKQALRKKVLSALFYPIFIVVATLVMTGILTVVVFPKVLPIFTSINVALPFSTRVLMFVSRFLISHGFLVLLAIILLPFGIMFLLRIPEVKKKFHQIILSLPIGGNIAMNYYLANFARTIGLLLKGESRLNDALITAANTTENLIYKQEFLKIAESVNRGEKISAYMHDNPKYFPEMVGHMVAVGEKAGNLSESFIYLAEMYEAEVDDMTKNLSSLIEPVLMVVMGLLVGFVAVSIITPIYSITQKLHP